MSRYPLNQDVWNSLRKRDW